MVWFWLACTLSGPDELAADKTIALDSALEACREHADPDRVGQCMVVALTTRDQLNPGQCASVTGRWRGRCVLQVGEREVGALSVRYQRCKQTVGDAQNCRFQLWQSDVLALQPGHPDHALELEGMRTVVQQHQLHGGDENPAIGDEMWAWFWGAWWEQRGGQALLSGDLSQCDGFLSPIDSRLCKEWAPAALQWIDARVPPSGQAEQRPDAPDGAGKPGTP